MHYDIRRTVVPDTFDSRDLVYRPLLSPLPPCSWSSSWPEPESQEGRSCVGHAMANLIEIVSLRTKRRWRRALATILAPVVRERPSAEMIYQLALRYDEELGANGTSLRAALKGWYHHGVALRSLWQDRIDDIENDEFRKHCLDRPLGAYYRINHRRLDDVQSAICESGAVVAALRVHTNWVRKAPPATIPDHWELGDGGLDLHAVAVIGYDHKGFQILNSYGPGWGNAGTWSITYGTWLKCAVDAWVARIGVPGTIGHDDLTRSGRSTLDGPAARPAPNRDTLRLHLVSLGHDGGFCRQGRYVSSRRSLEATLEKAGSSEAKHIMVWFHDSMLEDEEQRWIADGDIAWWEENGIYPIYVCWPARFVRQALEDVARRIERELPATGVHADMRHQVDRLSERWARGLAASWQELIDLPTKRRAKYFLARLSRGLAERKKQNQKIHYAAAGNGCSYLLALLDRAYLDRDTSALVPQPSTISLLAPTCDIKELSDRVQDVPNGSEIHLYSLTDEADEVAGHQIDRFRIHSRSFLTVVARSLAQRGIVRSDWERIEAAVAGLDRHARRRDNPRWSLRQVPSEYSGARSPLELNTDPLTLTSIARDMVEPQVVQQKPTLPRRS